MKKNRTSLEKLTGNWESVNLNPSVIIYKNDDTYLLSIIHINETTKQASPATYEIQEDEEGLFINYSLKRTAVSYDKKQDTLTISTMGDYMRN